MVNTLGSAGPMPTWQLGPSIQPPQPTSGVPLRHVKFHCLDIRQDVGGADLADAMGYDLIRTGPGPPSGIQLLVAPGAYSSHTFFLPPHIGLKRSFFTCIREVGLHARSRKKVDGTLLPALFSPLPEFLLEIFQLGYLNIGLSFRNYAKYCLRLAECRNKLIIKKDR
jgi:hypothetical protein